MKIEIVHLKNYYPIIEQFGADPVLELMIQENFLKSLMRPVVLILPGGGYTRRRLPNRLPAQQGTVPAASASTPVPSP